MLFRSNRINTTDEIFNVHLQIRDIIQVKINTMPDYDSQQAQNMIRSEVHDFMVNNNIYSKLTVENLRNTNFFINLLIHEFIINSLWVYDDEKFILENIATAIIIETLSHIQHTPTEQFYNNDEVLQQIVKTIVTRFLNDQ